MTAAAAGERLSGSSSAGSSEAPEPVEPGEFAEITLVVPARNEESSLADCLAAIRAQSYPSEKIEILVVDGGSRDGTREIVAAAMASDRRISLLHNPSGRVSSALNLALTRARGELLLRIDAHTLIAPDYVERCVELLRASGADNVGGPMSPTGRGALGEAIASAMRSRFGVGPARFRYARRVEEVDTVYLGAFRRALFERIGGFNEALVRNQDYEMNYRIRRAGGRILVDPEIRSVYLVRSDLASLWRQFGSYGYWKPQMLRRHPASLRPRQLAAPALVAALALGAVAGLAGRLWPEAPRWFAWTAPVVVALYLGASLAVASLIGWRRGWGVVWRLPAVFATMHLAWGAGFWWGIVRPPAPAPETRASPTAGADRG